MEKNKQAYTSDGSTRISFSAYPRRFDYPKAEEIKSPRERAHEENLGELAERFEEGHTPYTLDELREQAQGITEEWAEDGFNTNIRGSEPFVDEAGQLVMVGLLNNELDGMPDDHGEKTWRVLFDNTVVTVTPSKEFRPNSIHFRSGSGGDGIYTTRLVRDAVPSEELQRLISKFGCELGLSYVSIYNRDHSFKGHKNSLHAEHGDFCSLSEVASKVEQDKYEADWDEALAIEAEAQASKDTVRKRHLFMTARKLMLLREAAYRDSIRRSISPKD